ncbi:MAG TPA: 50S ribosomal protein L25, partial [Thermoanaerobaculia bacterium]|nr:50S ribosomal protein L25 [Thermoanaerobaculia bacterium]
MDAKVRVKVPVEITGTAWGVKNEGGMLDFMSRELEVECLPGRIPEEIRIDVSDMHAGDHVRVADLGLPEGVELREDPERVIVAVAHARVAATGEPGAEGAEAAAAEPEVIRRGKTETPES